MTAKRREEGMDRAPYRNSEALLSRRRLLVQGLKLGLSLPAASALVAACGNGSDTSSGTSPSGAATTKPTGQATMLNYVGWMGENEVETFEEEFPGATIKQAPDTSSSIAGRVQLIKQNLDQYDFSLGDEAFVAQAEAAGILGAVNFDNIPNIENVEQTFRNDYPRGIPTDYGKVGIGYRTDMVSESITGWADFFALAPKYSGQIVVIDLDRDCLGSALIYHGYSTNSVEDAELAEATQTLLELKPHIQAIKYYNVGAGLARGTAAMAMDWDFDVAMNQQKEPNIEWVFPEEGATAYLEGWVAVEGTDELDVVEAFMNFHLEPEQYADFVNTTGTAYVMEAATPFIDESISQNPILTPDPSTLAKVEFEKFLGEGTPLWAKYWDQFKSA
jgi:spermidine/putrescine transport system substrate-binding protein